MLNSSNSSTRKHPEDRLPASERQLEDLQNHIRRWLFEDALPWWAANSWDTVHGGVVEAFSFDGVDAARPVKRTRVACRQIYAFSHAHILGWSGGLELAGQCLRHLTETLWTGPKTGLPKLMTRSGEVADATVDLYDHSFALFAFSWYARATGSQNALDWVYRTIDFIETNLRHPTGKGFQNQSPASGARLQNPHMHLTEACLAAFETTNDPRFAKIGREMVDLFRDYFFNLPTGILSESFTDDLQRISGPDGQIIEPGHQFEWSWLLNGWRKHLDLDLAPEIRALHEFAERWGVDQKTGAVRDAINIDRTVMAGGSRIWPNTERLKSAIAVHDLDGSDVTPILRQTTSVLLDRYLATDKPGLWIDSFNDQAHATAPDVPTSTLYHLFLAFAELLNYQRPET